MGMAAVLSRAACFIGIIFMGYGLRRLGFFKPEDFHVLSKVVLKITLPAAIIVSFAGKEIDPSMLVLCLLGLDLHRGRFSYESESAGREEGFRDSESVRI